MDLLSYTNLIVVTSTSEIKSVGGVMMMMIFYQTFRIHQPWLHIKITSSTLHYVMIHFSYFYFFFKVITSCNTLVRFGGIFRRTWRHVSRKVP